MKIQLILIVISWMQDLNTLSRFSN